MRKAGFGKIVEQVASFLADNPLTQSWRQTTDRYVISPIERAMLNDQKLATGVADVMRGATPKSGVLTDRQRQAFRVLRGDDVNYENLQRVISESTDPAAEVGDQALSLVSHYGTKRQQLEQAADLLVNGRTGMTDTGDIARQYGLGSPVAAYSAVTAGGALGIKALMDLAAYLEAQQQTEKESQLPLS